MGMEHPWCQLWMWYNASGNGRTDVDDTQRPGRINTCTTADNTVYRTERMAPFELKSPRTRTFRWAVLTALLAVTWSTERFVRAGCQRTCAYDQVTCLTGLKCVWHVTPIKESGLLHQTPKVRIVLPPQKQFKQRDHWGRSLRFSLATTDLCLWIWGIIFTK
jgi:hypothetical protein